MAGARILHWTVCPFPWAGFATEALGFTSSVAGRQDGGVFVSRSATGLFRTSEGHFFVRKKRRRDPHTGSFFKNVCARGKTI